MSVPGSRCMLRSYVLQMPLLRRTFVDPEGFRVSWLVVVTAGKAAQKRCRWVSWARDTTFLTSIRKYTPGLFKNIPSCSKSTITFKNAPHRHTSNILGRLKVSLWNVNKKLFRHTLHKGKCWKKPLHTNSKRKYAVYFTNLKRAASSSLLHCHKYVFFSIILYVSGKVFWKRYRFYAVFVGSLLNIP